MRPLPLRRRIAAKEPMATERDSGAWKPHKYTPRNTPTNTKRDAYLHEHARGDRKCLQRVPMDDPMALGVWCARVDLAGAEPHWKAKAALTMKVDYKQADGWPGRLLRRRAC